VTGLDQVGRGYWRQTSRQWGLGPKTATMAITALRLALEGTGPAAPVLPEAAVHEASAALPVLLLVGGIGRMEAQYEAVAQQQGYRLVYVEKGRIPSALRPALILVVTTVTSHPLREQAAEVARVKKVSIVYLQEPSMTSVRRALEAQRAA